MEIEGSPQDTIAQQLHSLCLPDSCFQALNCQGIFCPNINIPLASTDGVGCNCHTLQHTMGIALQHAAIHKSARIALISIADDEFLRPAGLRNGAPLQAGGIACATTTAQSTTGDVVNDLSR